MPTGQESDTKEGTEFMCEEKAAKLFAPKQKGGETTHKLRLLLDFNKKQQWNRKNKVAIFLHSSRKKRIVQRKKHNPLYRNPCTQETLFGLALS